VKNRYIPWLERTDGSVNFSRNITAQGTTLASLVPEEWVVEEAVEVVVRFVEEYRHYSAERSRGSSLVSRVVC
jgi:hypothetical protein